MSKLSRLPNNAASELQPQHMSRPSPSSPLSLCLLQGTYDRQRDRRFNNPGYEVCIQGALEHVASGKYTSLREAARGKYLSRHYLFFRIHLTVLCFIHAFGQGQKLPCELYGVFASVRSRRRAGSI
jgi:hypothetical protein